MLSSIWVSSALCAVALAAPALPTDLTPAQTDVLSQYFQLLASKVQDLRSASPPVCNLNNAVMPASSQPLPPPSAGLTLKHVAIGRGTQNYTCGTDPAAAPTANGAVATLFNASCIASTSPTVLAAIPNVALQFNLSSINSAAALAPSNLVMSGHHFFTTTTTPFFDMNALGSVPCAKNNSVPAPAGAPMGQAGVGSGSVPWLKLIAREGATGGLQEVYRLNTAGGSAPAACAGMPSQFQVQYSAEYWFYAS